MKPSLSVSELKITEKFQISEITEYIIYSKLAKREKNAKNRKTLETIANDELAHSLYWRTFTEKDAKPRRRTVLFFTLISRLLGLTFGLKLLEKGEDRASAKYGSLIGKIPGAKKIQADEDAHEKKLLSLIEEEKLNYAGSIVLGLNDALVELTGALAGLSFGFQNTKTIAFAGLVTGVAAGFSMAAAAYLSRVHDGEAHPVKSALYTGVAYFITVSLLILPFLFMTDFRVCIALTIAIAILIIFLFNFYISVAKDYPFKRRFAEMAIISIGVTVISFAVSLGIKSYFGIDL
jgi:VIT1/CCC1 family predicted Fe2+/Mn2+ transporter